MLQPLQQQRPLGQFDGLDSQYLTILGGEVVTLGSTSITSTDLDAYDVKDGYSGTTSKVRPVVTNTLTSGNRPLWLADEGVAGYGTLFGSIVGGIAGQVTTPVVVGPSTAAGSGKVTCWNEPGLYKVSLDAVDTSSITGLVPTNTTITPGAALYAQTNGKLTPASGAAFEAVILGRFIEFATNGSLVTTPQSLVAALNSPSGPVSSVGLRSFTFAVFEFSGHKD